MITTELEFLKCHERLEQLVELVQQSGADGRRIDEVERVVFAELLQMSLLLTEAFVKLSGDGDIGETMAAPAVPADSTTSAEESDPPVRRSQRRLETLHDPSHSGRSKIAIPLHQRTRDVEESELRPSHFYGTDHRKRCFAARKCIQGATS